MERTLALYHWSPTINRKFGVVDPECFLTRRHHYTLNDYRVSALPRSFFYLNPDHKEQMIRGDLYTTVISASDLYDLNDDPLEMRIKASAGYRSNINIGSMNFTELLENIHKQLIMPGHYNGIFYGTKTQIACMFVPIEVKKAVSLAI